MRFAALAAVLVCSWRISKSVPSLVSHARLAEKPTRSSPLYLYRSNICRKMELNPELTASVVMDSEDKGESYVDIEIENHTFRTICCGNCGHEFQVPIYCGDRFCRVCSIPRRMRVRRRLEFLVTHTKKEPGYGLKFLTLTIPSQPDLSGMLEHLVRSFRKLRQRAGWKRRVLGGAFVIECSRSISGWHCHIHALTYSKYISFEYLLKLWLSCSGGRGVFIKQIPSREAINYLTKYLSKPVVPTNYYEEVSTSLKHYRLFQPFGCWMSLLKDFHESKPGCPECGSHTFFPLDLIYSDRFTSPVYSNTG